MNPILFAMVDAVLVRQWESSMSGCFRPRECKVCADEMDTLGWWRSCWPMGGA